MRPAVVGLCAFLATLIVADTFAARGHYTRSVGGFIGHEIRDLTR